jgi:hypothetical protein
MNFHLHLHLHLHLYLHLYLHFYLHFHLHLHRPPFPRFCASTSILHHSTIAIADIAKIACGLSEPEEKASPEEFAREVDFSPKPTTSFDMKHDTWERSESGRTRIYYSPWDEFDLLYTKLASGEKDKTGEGVMGPTIFVVTEGEVLMKHHGGLQGEKLKKGQVVFVKPGNGWEWEAAEGGAEVWGAFVEGA